MEEMRLPLEVVEEARQATGQNTTDPSLGLGFEWWKGTQRKDKPQSILREKQTKLPGADTWVSSSITASGLQDREPSRWRKWIRPKTHVTDRCQ